MQFEPTRKSLRSHRVPEWYDDAKLGIFIHWSVSSIPAFAPRGGIEAIFKGETGQGDSPYSEWYWNSIKIPGSAAAKAWLSEAAVEAVETALQIHGGVGFTWEYDVHLQLRRARCGAATQGDADFHRDRVAAHMERVGVQSARPPRS